MECNFDIGFDYNFFFQFSENWAELVKCTKTGLIKKVSFEMCYLTNKTKKAETDNFIDRHFGILHIVLSSSLSVVLLWWQFGKFKNVTF